MLYSYDGITWTNIDSPLFNEGTKEVCLSLCSNGKRTIVIGNYDQFDIKTGINTNRKIIGYSDDGITWLSLDTDISEISADAKIKWDGAVFIIITGSTTYYSIDGIDWNIHRINIGDDSGNMMITDIFTQYEDSNIFCI